MRRAPRSMTPITSPAHASSTLLRSRPMSCCAAESRSVFPVRTCSTSMPGSKWPEQRRTKAMRSRCRGSMFAWILNTKPVNSVRVGSIGPMLDSRAVGDGASLRKSWRKASTPKLVSALPKCTGVMLPSSRDSWLHWWPGLIQQAHLVGKLGDAIGTDDLQQFRRVHVVHQRIGDAGAVILGALEQRHLLRAAIVDAGKPAAGEHRPRHRIAVDAELGLDVAQELERVLAGPVALVDEGEDRHAAALADGEELPGALLDALPVVEQHDGAVGGDEGAVGVLGEVLVARGVEQVDAIAVVVEGHHAAGDGDAALALELHPVAGDVAGRPAGLHAAGQVDGAAVQEELLRQGGLAGVGMADDGHRPAAGHLGGEAGVETAWSGRSRGGHGRGVK